ncbi:ML-like domain-containing protein [Madurella fahalii]|uniref:ML-like domain-containing protein n=1 Tax=Madurella fahalii TaxID=1157608 RepID=A0ABQ0G453_9PEZI
MHLVSCAVWSVMGSLACLGALVNAAGVLEIDVVSPRPNGTYAPREHFPIIFAIQNANMAQLLQPEIYLFIRNGPDLRSAFGDSIHDLTYANYSSEPYFVYHHVNIETEGRYQLFSTVTWRSCNVSGDEVSILGNDINFNVYFNISRGAQEVDLVAATANDKTCPPENRVTINMTDQILEVAPVYWDAHRPSGTYAVLASSSPTPTANPCQVRIDTAVVASMSASLHAALCKGLNQPADSPKEDNAVQLLTVAGVTSFAAAFGAICFLFA